MSIVERFLQDVETAHANGHIPSVYWMTREEFVEFLGSQKIKFGKLDPYATGTLGVVVMSFGPVFISEVIR